MVLLFLFLSRVLLLEEVTLTVMRMKEFPVFCFFFFFLLLLRLRLRLLLFPLLLGTWLTDADLVRGLVVRGVRCN